MQAHSLKASGSRSRSVWVWALWLAGGLAGFQFATIAPDLAARAVALGRHEEPDAWIQETARYDPKVGERYALPTLYDPDGKPKRLPTPGHPACILFVWKCGNCEVDRKLRTVQALFDHVPQVNVYIVVIRGEPKTARTLQREYGLRIPVLVDRNGAVAKKLNAVFMARAYLFDRSGRLRYVSSYGEDLEQLTPRARALAEGDLAAKGS